MNEYKRESTAQHLSLKHIQKIRVHSREFAALFSASPRLGG
jgi:hypothetical protein